MWAAVDCVKGSVIALISPCTEAWPCALSPCAHAYSRCVDVTQEWCKKQLGEDGENMDDELKAAFMAKGEAGLTKLLAKRYRAEFS